MSRGNVQTPPPIDHPPPLTAAQLPTKYALLVAGELPTPEQLAKLAELLDVDAETVGRWFDRPAMDRVLTVEEVAQLLAVGERTVYELLRAGELHGRKVGKRWVTTARHLHAFIDGVDEPL